MITPRELNTLNIFPVGKCYLALALLLAIAAPVGAVTLAVEEDVSAGWHGHKFKFENREYLRIEQWGSNGNRRGPGKRNGKDDHEDKEHAWKHWGKRVHQHHSFVRFDLSIIGAGLAAEDLLQASLRLFVTRVISGGRVHIHRVLQDWDEHSLADGTLPSYEALAAASFSVDKADQGHFRFVDITPILQDWYDNPATNHGLVFIAENANLWADSKENKKTSQPMTIELSLARVGPEGPQGIRGPRGIQGIQGVQGEQGEQGERGEQGEQGIQGIQGIRGIQGIQGERGEQGEQGIQGEQGEQGPVGPAGDQQRNVIRVAIEGGDFTDIQAAIDSVPLRDAPGAPGLREVTPTLITVAPGEYFGQVRLRQNIHLQGAGEGQSRIYPTQDPFDCGNFSALICILGASNVQLDGLLLSGLTPAGVPFAEVETAIAIFNSSDLRILENRIVDLPFGINGERVDDIEIRHNRIPHPADAIVLSGNGAESTFRIADNRIENGSVTLFTPGRILLTSNAILGDDLFSSLDGVLQVTGNQFLGNVEFDATGPSTFTANLLRGMLILEGPGRVSVNGNSLARVFDNGNALIVGNDFLPPANGFEGNPIVDASDNSTIFGNRFLGQPNGYAVNSLVSDHQIRLESREELVEIQAGNTRITVEENGDISIIGDNDLTIEADGDLNIEADGDLTISARSIAIESGLETIMEAGTDLTLEAGLEMALDSSNDLSIDASSTLELEGTQVDISGTTRVDISAGAIVDIDAPVLNLN